MSRASLTVLRTLDIGCLTGLWGGMNDPEVTMSNAVPETKLVAHEKAVEAAGIAIALVMRVPAPLKSIADQVIRSASSVPANLAEGQGRTGRAQRDPSYPRRFQVDFGRLGRDRPADVGYAGLGTRRS